MQDKKTSIILIEDDPGHALLIERSLRRNDISHHLVHFDNGQEALDYFSEWNLHGDDHGHVVVLLDLNLPRVDGFEILQYLKQQPHTGHIPIMVLTTTDNPHEIERCYKLGCDICIIKPVDDVIFHNALSDLGILSHAVKSPQMIKE